jgi:hypothetical protein
MEGQVVGAVLADGMWWKFFRNLKGQHGVEGDGGGGCRTGQKDDRVDTNSS